MRPMARAGASEIARLPPCPAPREPTLAEAGAAPAGLALKNHLILVPQQFS
jgi:hypothetical protein